MKYLTVFFAFILSFVLVSAQKSPGVQILTSGTNTSLRGMSIPNNNVIWVSGSNGTIGKSIDGGKTWRWIIVTGFEKKDFRDIQAFDSSTAIAMAIDNPAIILKTIDGGNTWKKVFEKSMEGMFLDAMDFKNNKEGICVGDPLAIGMTSQKFFYILKTSDGGDTWVETAVNNLVTAQTGEAIFSGSGTNISFLDNPDFEFAFVTGGMVSNLHLIGRQGKPNKAVNIPVMQGKESAGTFSMATDKQKTFYCIGGDYKAPKDSSRNFSYTTNTGAKWQSASLGAPLGYRSCIQIINNKTLVACGTTGVDYTFNGQKDWRNISTESFNVCTVSKGKQVFFAGEKGKIGKLVY